MKETEMLPEGNEPSCVTFLTLCFCSCTFRLADGCWRFTDGFFQGSLKVICALARLVFSMCRLQHVTWEGVSGGLLPHPGRILLREGKEGFNSPLAVDDAGLSGRKWLLGAQGEGEGWGRARHLLPLFPPVRLPCKWGLGNRAYTLAPESETNAACRRDDHTAPEASCMLSFIPLLQ